MLREITVGFYNGIPASQGGPFWERKPNGPGFNISSGGSTPGEAEAFLDRKSLEF